MNCETVENGNAIERYVLGQLTEAERGSFEEHYFHCDACFEQVRLLQEIQAAGAGRRRNVTPMPSRKWAVWGAVAAVLVAGITLAAYWRVLRGGPSEVAVARPAAPAASAPDPMLLLAKVEAPRYTPATLRGGSGNAEERYRAAMEHYSRGEYAAAAEGLRGLAAPAARFYLGISALMMGNADDAIVQLRAVDSMGETPYLEQARFFLAKALLARHDAAGAERALEETIALSGDREPEARRLLEQLRALAATRP